MSAHARRLAGTSPRATVCPRTRSPPIDWSSAGRRHIGRAGRRRVPPPAIRADMVLGETCTNGADGRGGGWPQHGDGAAGARVEVVVNLNRRGWMRLETTIRALEVSFAVAPGPRGGSCGGRRAAAADAC